MSEEWISVKDAARIRKCTDANIRYLISEGKLEAVKESGKWKVKVDSQGQQKESLPPADILAVLKAQLQDCQEQVKFLQEELSNVRERSDTIILALTQQNQLMIEDKSASWYRRLFRRRGGAGEGSKNT